MSSRYLLAYSSLSCKNSMQRCCCLLKTSHNVTIWHDSCARCSAEAEDASSCRRSIRLESLSMFLIQEDSVGCNLSGGVLSGDVGMGRSCGKGTSARLPGGPGTCCPTVEGADD